MSLSKDQKTSPKKADRKNRAAEVANTFEWLITALILALLVMTFIMQAFRIPTGSMADTLKGAHFRLRCLQCGYRYDRGFVQQEYRLPQDTIPLGQVRPPKTRCPSCGHYDSTSRAFSISNGDRILVLKCVYQFFKPKQWDVIVFKNPLEPKINYIKRLVGRPRETVEIIDGDIYINGRISRKPAKVQEELWMPVYDNDYQPVRPREGSFNGHFWQQPFKNDTNSKWKPDKESPTIFRLDSPADQMNTLIYDSSIGNDFRAAYAYNDVRKYEHMPYCSDLMVRFCARSTDPQGRIGIELNKYKVAYSAWVDLSGDMVIAEVSAGKEWILDNKLIEPPTVNKPALVKFANVDHQLIFQFGKENLTWDLGRDPDGAGQIRADIPPRVKIFGSGKLTVSNIAIFRDIHYTAKNPNSSESGRATEGKAFKLGKDEFFVLGDNSPNSEDGRWWSSNGVGNNGLSYRQGIVPRDYLVGKALFVYWPSGFRPYGKFPFAIVPNVGQVRFIYGGSGR